MSIDLSQYTSVCTLNELQESNLSNATIHCLTRGQTIGLTLSTVSSTTSLLSVTVVFILIIRNYIDHVRHPPPGEWRLLREPMDVYMLSLFFSNLLQALGTTLDVKWLHDGKLETSSYCTAQGAIQQLGETSVAMCTFAIALHTFIVVWWAKSVQSLRAAFYAIGVIWLFVILYVGIGVGVHRNDDYEVPSPYWCWLGSRYMKEKITGEYMWFWLTLATSILVYISLYLLSRGNITVDMEHWWKFSVHRAPDPDPDDDEADNNNNAMSVMLVYPLVYSIIVMPLSVVRWIAFVQESKGNNNGISSQATFIVDFIYQLSGFLDVMLFFFTRSGLLLFTKQPFPTAQGRAPSPSPPPSEKGHARMETDATRVVHGVTLTNGDSRNQGRLPEEDGQQWDFPQLD